MSVRIQWSPNTESDIKSYELVRCATKTGTYALVTTIVHDLLGANYDATASKFFYDDTAGTTAHWYKLRAVDQYSNPSGYTNPFQPGESTTPPVFPNTVSLTEDYPTTDNLRYITAGAAGVGDAQVRVYKKTDYDQGKLTLIQGQTTTDANGRWKVPILVEAGTTYTIYFQKPHAFGPDTTEVVVPS
jgi:hypothetical protein